jgi:hypothetical protein
MDQTLEEGVAAFVDYSWSYEAVLWERVISAFLYTEEKTISVVKILIYEKVSRSHIQADHSIKESFDYYVCRVREMTFLDHIIPRI